MLLLFLFFTPNLASSWWPPTSDTSCSYTRDDSFNCLKKYIDINPKNNEITQDEINAGVKKYLPTYLRPMFWWIGSDKIMNDCDYDKNGVITPRDWIMSKDTCFPAKKDQCTIQWFCEKAGADSSSSK